MNRAIRRAAIYARMSTRVLRLLRIMSVLREAFDSIWLHLILAWAATPSKHKTYNSIPIARSRITGNKSLIEILAPEASHLMAGKGIKRILFRHLGPTGMSSWQPHSSAVETGKSARTNAFAGQLQSLEAEPPPPSHWRTENRKKPNSFLFVL